MQNVEEEHGEEKESDQGCPPGDDEHDGQAQQGAAQRQPHVVVFEARTESCKEILISQVIFVQ